MESKFFIVSPLEQFEIIPLISLPFGFFDFSITNQTIILSLIVFFIITFFFSCLKQQEQSLFMIPHRWQSVIEFIYSFILSMVSDNIDGKKNQMFFFFFSNTRLLTAVGGSPPKKPPTACG